MTRFPWCRHYAGCLTDAALRDLPRLDCERCQRFELEDHLDDWELLGLVRLAYAIFGRYPEPETLDPDEDC